MRFSTVFSVLACGAMALAAAVAPDALVSRTNSDISGVVSTLDQQCNSILPRFDTCNDADCTEAIVVDLCAAIDVATSACGNLSGGNGLIIGNQIAAVVTKIAVKLDSHQSSCNGQCGDLSVYAKVDLSLSLLLKQLGVCVSGILTLVSTLLVTIVGLLEGICLNLTLKVCLLI